MKLSGKPKKINHLVSTKLKPVSENSNSHKLVLAFIPFIFMPSKRAHPNPNLQSFWATDEDLFQTTRFLLKSQIFPMVQKEIYRELCPINGDVSFVIDESLFTFLASLTFANHYLMKPLNVDRA